MSTVEGWGTADYPPNWDDLRTQVYERDDYTCQHCGSQGGPNGDVELHAHHVIPKSKGGSHQPSNLETLCADCHDDVHDHPIARNGGHGDDSDDTAVADTDADPWTPDGAVVVLGCVAFLALVGVTISWELVAAATIVGLVATVVTAS